MKEAGKAEAGNAWSLQELGARSCDRQAGSFGGRPAKFNSQLNPGFIPSVCLPEVEGEDEWGLIF